MNPSGLTIKHYQLIAEREGLKLIFLDENEKMQENDLLDWLHSQYDKINQSTNTAWVSIENGSSFIGQTRKQVFPNRLNSVIRLHS